MLKFVPNIITILRIFLAFSLIPAISNKNFIVALIIFVIAAVSDYLDGYLARKFQITSKIGAMLDPVADKLLMFCSYGLFAYEKIISVYVATIVIFRDILILLAVIISILKKIKIKYRPLMSSKINTTVQLIFIVMVLVCKILIIQIPWPLELVVCGFTIYSGLDYIRAWMKNEFIEQ